MNEKFNEARKAIVAKVLEALENGVPMWKQPWWSAARRMHSISSGKPYRGMNAIITSLAYMQEGYDDPRWATYKYITDNGYKFVKPAKGKGVNVYRYVFEKEEGEDEDAVSGRSKLKYIITNTVFNVSLTDIPKEVGVVNEFTAEEAGEMMLAASPCPILYGGEESYYVPKDDRIHLPERGRFFGANEFYGTAFHEMIHATGAKTRLSRNISGGFGSHDYAREELVAELGAVFLASMLGMPIEGNERKNSIAYIGNWLKHIREEKREADFIDAVKAAESASDFLYALYKGESVPEPLQIHVLKYGVVSKRFGLCLLPVHSEEKVC